MFSAPFPTGFSFSRFSSYGKLNKRSKELKSQIKKLKKYKKIKRSKKRLITAKQRELSLIEEIKDVFGKYKRKRYNLKYSKKRKTHTKNRSDVRNRLPRRDVYYRKK